MSLSSLYGRLAGRSFEPHQPCWNRPALAVVNFLIDARDVLLWPIWRYRHRHLYKLLRETRRLAMETTRLAEEMERASIKGPGEGS